MNDDAKHIVKLLEDFISPDYEIRSESERLYKEFEEQDPENAIQTLFQIISANISFNSSQQALIRLRLFLQSSLSTSPSIPLEDANLIKSFLIEFISSTDNSQLAKYSISIIISFYFKTSKNNEMWDGFFQFLTDLYSKEPLLSLYSLTTIYDFYKINEIAPQICDFMIFNQDPQLFAQSLTSGLILIKHQFLFDNYEEFIGNLSNMFSFIPDEYLSDSLETFRIAFKGFYEPFLSSLADIFLYFLDTIADIDRNENVRVQCMYILTDLTTNSNEFRSILISNPNNVISAIAIAVSDPYQFADIYKEAKKSLKYILEASLYDIEVFDESLKEFGMNDNIYVQSVMLYHITSDFSLNFAYENIFHEEIIIRHNCMRIIIRMFNKSYEICEQSLQGDIFLKERDEGKVVDIFVEYLQNSNFEIYKFFKIWCECGGSNSLYKCINPIIDLLNSKSCDDKVLIMASLLCSCYPENQDLQEVGVELLEFSKSSFLVQANNDVYLEVVKNLLPLLDSENRTNYLNEILPYVFNSITLTVSRNFIEIIERIEQNFVPYIEDYLNVLIQCATTAYGQQLHPVDAEEILEFTTSITNTEDPDVVIVFNDSDLKNLQQMLQSLTMVTMKFPEICRSSDFFPKIIEILKIYLVFPYDDEVQKEAITSCTDFIEKFADDDEIDVILELIEPIESAIDLSYDLGSLSSLSSTLMYITGRNDPNYAQYLDKLVPLAFNKLYEIIQSYYEEDKYFDGMEMEWISEAFDSLSNSFEEMFDIDPSCAVSQFQQITSIVHYFNLPNLDDKVREFISIIWVDFLSFAPSNEKPQSPPDILNDLFEFYYNCCDNKIRYRIICSIGTVVFFYVPQFSLSTLSEFESIIENEEEYLDVKEAAAIQYAKLMTKCDNDDFILKIDILLHFAELFESGSDDIGKFCANIVIVIKHAIMINCDSSIPQNLISVITSLIEQDLLDDDDYNSILEECEGFDPLQSFSESILDLIRQASQHQTVNSNDDIDDDENI